MIDSRQFEEKRKEWIHTLCLLYWGRVIDREVKGQRYTLEDIDDRLEDFSEFAKVLGIDSKVIISHILTSLKLKLNNEVKKTTSMKRHRLLEYMFPYAVLQDYSPLVSYLLEKEESIPEVVIDKLLHDPTYKEYLTPSIKVKIYKREPLYFEGDVESALNSLPTKVSRITSIANKCCCFHKSKLLECITETEFDVVFRCDV